jgi:ribosomal protein L40E
MARVWFEGLPDFSTPGGTVTGTLALEADGAVRATDLELHLHGQETAQTTVGAGKHRRTTIYPTSDPAVPPPVINPVLVQQTIVQQTVEVRCRYCGSLNPVSATKCASCGAAL